MKKINLVFSCMIFTFSVTAQNVGVGIGVPAAKLHIKGGLDATQLIIEANSVQSNSKPLVILRSSNGNNLMWIHADHITNSFVGLNAGRVNDTSTIASGRFNTFIGSNAGYSNTTGNGNTAGGSQSLYTNSTGTHNTGNGTYTLFSNISGSNNTAMGVQALYLNTTGSVNTAVGELSLFKNTTGISNTANGYQALQSNIDGNYNTAMGVGAAINNSSGSDNTAMGVGSLNANTSGSNNTAVGFHALIYCTQGSQNIAIGAESGTDPGSPAITNTISIGNFNILNAASNQAFFGNLSTLWNGGNKTWSTFSDARMKTNITADVKGLDFIMRLRPVTYNRSIKAAMKITGAKETPDFAGKYDVEKAKESGFLAQEVEQSAKEAGYDFSGVSVPKSPNQLYTLSYEQFVVPLVKAVQEQQAIIEALSGKIELLLKEMALLKVKMK